MRKTIRLVVIYILSISNFNGKAQDTLSIMSYNILNYNSTDANKSRYLDLRTIVKNANPDILMLCEIADPTASQYLLDSALNKAGVGTYTRAAFFDGTDTDNTLFYKTNKVKLRSQKQIGTVLRDISQYLMYKVVATNDTAFFYLHMSHLKAGSLTSDEMQRDTEITAFCTDISSIPQTANIIIAGDMNLKASTEPAFVTLSSGSCSHVFSDPINQLGSWNNNNAFSKLFTQSTRTSANPGCCGGSTGGLDDRFDLLLITNPIITGDNKVSYLPGSYKAFGNDNQHMNLSMLDGPTNTVVPTNVAQALFNMSDHLPVMMKVVLRPSALGLKINSLNNSEIKIWNTFHSTIGIMVPEEGNYNLQIIDLTGKKVIDIPVKLEKGEQEINLSKFALENALYYVVLSDRKVIGHTLLSIDSN